MKIVFVMCFGVALGCLALAGNHKNVTPVFNTPEAADTIEFVMRKHFLGQCNNDCYVYIGDSVTVVNRRKVKPGNAENYALFSQCPFKIRLQKNKPINFLLKNLNLITAQQ